MPIIERPFTDKQIEAMVNAITLTKKVAKLELQIAAKKVARKRAQDNLAKVENTVAKLATEKLRYVAQLAGIRRELFGDKEEPPTRTATTMPAMDQIGREE